MFFRFFYVIMFIVCNLQAAPSILQSGAGFSVLAPTQITQSGVYKLSQDIVGTVTIAANNVIFDLNNHQIFPPSAGDGIDISNQTDITIQNGIINAGNNGVSINSCIAIENTALLGQISNGVLLQASTNINIDNCNFQGEAGYVYGLQMVNAQFCAITSSDFFNYSASSVSGKIGTGIYLDVNSANNMIFSCKIMQNVYVMQLLGSFNVIQNCLMEKNNNGILVPASNNVIIDNIIENTTNGDAIKITAGNNTITNNIIQKSSAGNGIDMIGSSNNTINNNTVSFNGIYGINASSSNAIFGNTAQQNTSGILMVFLQVLLQFIHSA